MNIIKYSIAAYKRANFVFFFFCVYDLKRCSDADRGNSLFGFFKWGFFALNNEILNCKLSALERFVSPLSTPSLMKNVHRWSLHSQKREWKIMRRENISQLLYLSSAHRMDLCIALLVLMESSSIGKFVGFLKRHRFRGGKVSGEFLSVFPRTFRM